GVKPAGPAKKSAKDTVLGRLGQLEGPETGDRLRAASREEAAPARWRPASNRAIPAATDTLSDSICPAMGMRTRKSQESRVRRRIPSPSAPSTSASGRLRSAAYSV